jgi:hypothetical protein
MLVGWSVLDLCKKVTYVIFNCNSNVSSDSNYSADSSHNSSRSDISGIGDSVDSGDKQIRDKTMSEIFFGHNFFYITFLQN